MKPKSTEGHGRRRDSGRVKPVASLGTDKTTAGDPLGLGFNLVFPGSADRSEGKRCLVGAGTHPFPGLQAKPSARHFSAASWLRSGTLSIPYLIYPPLGKGRILSQQEMFSSLYVFPSPVLRSSHALDCDRRKPWKHKQTDGNRSRERVSGSVRTRAPALPLPCARRTAPSAGTFLPLVLVVE